VTAGQTSIETAIAGITSLRNVLKKGTTKQVRSEDEKLVIKATAHAWFNNHRGTIGPFVGLDALSGLDSQHRKLLEGTARSTLRGKYDEITKAIKKLLTGLQADHVVELATPPPAAPPALGATVDPPPAFTPLITDAKMQAILQSRWQECVICVKHGASLGATVMMGGLLEGLLLARINQLTVKAPVFTAAAAPKDRKTGKPLPLPAWGLKDFINVAHELGWITTTAKSIGDVLRDYRNYIHPQKEFSHGVSLAPGDAEMLWNIAKTMITQVLKP
jgi:hypothetical protein